MVETMVTLFTNVPSSSCPDSICSARVEDGASSLSYEGGDRTGSAVSNDVREANIPSIFTGVNFHISPLSPSDSGDI